MSPVKPHEFRKLVSDPSLPLRENFVATLLKFPAYFARFYSWLFDEDGRFSETATGEMIALTVRTGDIKMIAGKTIPDGWLACNGQSVAREEYPRLFAEIGISYGKKDPQSFNVPDLRDAVPIGASAAKRVASRGGAATKQIELHEMPTHTHLVMKGAGALAPLTDGAGGVRGFAGMDVQDARASGEQSEVLLQPSGGGAEFSILPPYVAVTFIIKT